jgi:hypothetical protein
MKTTQTALIGNAVKDSCSRIRKNSGVSLRSLKSCDSSHNRMPPVFPIVSASLRCLIGAVLFAATTSAMADVDLVTIPRREGTQLTIYNSDDITMVREHRLLTVKPGVNRIQFAWANTLIDPTSIDFRILDHQDKVDLIDTTFPSGRTDALQWNIRSEMAGQIPVEIRYFTSGITWVATYVGIANQDETKLSLTGYVRVQNNSGELYDNAETRLVVGTINLVEKIADLAQRPAPGPSGAPKKTPAASTADPFGRAANEILAGAIAKAEDKSEVAKRVVKQGLSEYFCSLSTVAKISKTTSPSNWSA